MGTRIGTFDWDKFWEDISSDAPDVEGIIFRKDNGRWVTVFALPNSCDVIDCVINYNPFTGEKLE